jgi:cytochrome c oxidase assembly protein Cox11
LTSKNVFSFAQKKPSVQNLTNDPKLTYLRKRSTYLNIAMTCFMFAACFAAIPLYRTFCEHMGLSGDYEKKEYNFVDYKSTFCRIQ